MRAWLPDWLTTDLAGAIAAWIAVATNIVVASLVLFYRRPPRVGIDRVFQALAALALWIGFQLVVASRVSYFLCVHLVYLDVFVFLPVMGLALLRRGVVLTKPVRVACFASLALVPIGVYASFVEPYMLVTEHTNVALSPKRAGTQPIVVGVLADIQCGDVTDRERDAVARIMAAKPDLILIPGDLIQRAGRERKNLVAKFRALLAPLDAPLGVYFTQGNCEWWKPHAAELLEGTRVKILDNEIVELEHEDRRITLCGVDLDFSAPAREALQLIEKSPGDDDVRIVVAHRPDVIYALPRGSRVDLVVAGHTHGGQVQIPGFGPPITLSGVPRDVAAGGLHTLEGRQIYVSRGLGWEHGMAPRVRFLALPEVSVLTLETAATPAANPP